MFEIRLRYRGRDIAESYAPAAYIDESAPNPCRRIIIARKDVLADEFVIYRDGVEFRVDPVPPEMQRLRRKDSITCTFERKYVDHPVQEFFQKLQRFIRR